MHRKKGNPKLRSVTRIRDPRYPGILLRITELVHDGPLYAAQQVDGKPRYQKLEPQVTWLSLGPKPIEKATALALDLIERIATEPDAPEATDTKALTLGQLPDRYEVGGFHGLSPEYKRDAMSSVRRVAEFLGCDTQVTSITPSDVARYLTHREQQGVRVAGRADITMLSIAVNWAIGEGLLAEYANPIATKAVRKKLKGVHEVRRPVASRKRYDALKAVAGKLPAVFSPLLDLAWGTGHRIQAILNLRWRDCREEQSEQYPHGAITWYAGVKPDRKKHQHVVPVNAEVRAALMRWRALDELTRPKLTANDYLFPAPTDSTKPLNKESAYDLLVRAEKLAGLEHEQAGGWHAFRRGWATARKHLPLKDVQAAGGWNSKDGAALQTCYLHADEETTREAATHVA